MTRRAAFLDRDGVINVAPAPGWYVLKWEEFAFHESVFDWVRLFNALDMLVIVVTNQRCVARGLVTLAEVEAIHRRMVAEFASRGCRIDDVYVCPHGDGECDCRKPLPGMVRAAQAKWSIDLTRSIMIGDSERDRGLADACGLTFVRAEGGRLMPPPVESSGCGQV
ncbi:MAG: HAD family hydrolase [Gemmataceae bacterium]